VLFNKDPEKAAQKQAAKAEKKQLREEASAQRAAEKEALKEWRRAHPAEATMNTAALMKMWPSSKMGVTALGPVKGGSAEFVDAGAHKAWTATRLIAGVATAGVSAAATGRKNKGAAVINVTFGNGAAQTYTVKPEPSYLKAANQYVNAFNALAAQLAEEGEGADS
jgi:acetoin utilization deacetylase AcuC-like enzyme